MVDVPVKNQLTSEDFMDKAKTLQSKINDQLWTSEMGNKIVSGTDKKKKYAITKSRIIKNNNKTRKLSSP